MSNNLFESIVELYTESVKKADVVGLSEVYKQATEIVFEGLKERFPFGLNITDVEYLDGYFIFGHGTNSVVHFHIEETPGWKYGIWWSPISKNTKEGEEDDENAEYYTDRVHCSIFAQYEEEIDKFKPSASMVCEEFTIDFKKGNEQCKMDHWCNRIYVCVCVCNFTYYLSAWNMVYGRQLRFVDCRCSCSSGNVGLSVVP